MKYTKISIKTTKDKIESITYMLYDIGYTGLEIDDYSNENEVIVTIYESFEINILEKINYIKENINYLENIEYNYIDEDDYSNEWKKYYKPVEINDNVVVVPLWEEYESDKVVIKMDSDMAFGSGRHETTSLCMDALYKYIKKDHTVIDIGCGSGILSIAASKFAAKDIIAIDIDEKAIEISKNNISINDVDNIKVYEGNMLDNINIKADLIVANIMADNIIDLTKYINKHIICNGIFISSGILEERLEDVLEALKNNKFNILEIKKKGAWCAIVAQYV